MKLTGKKPELVATRGTHIYLNLKGRDTHGIVDPEDQYALEEEIITASVQLRDIKGNGLFSWLCATKMPKYWVCMDLNAATLFTLWQKVSTVSTVILWLPPTDIGAVPYLQSLSLPGKGSNRAKKSTVSFSRLTLLLLLQRWAACA